MEEKIFWRLKDHRFNNGLQLRSVASFAVWNRNNPGDVSEIERSIDKLNGHYVFVGLNPAGIENLPKGDPEKLKKYDWKMFHWSFQPNGGDLRIKLLLEKTKFEGAYMTDIIKDIATRQAGDLNWRNVLKEHPEHIDWFIEEINLLDVDNIHIYLFGGDVEKIFINNKKKLHSALRTKVILCQRIEHFGASNTRFPAWAPAQLGLKENTMGTKIFEPVWIE